MKCQTLTPQSWEVELLDGTRVLYSYGAPVAAVVPGSGVFKIAGFVSRTTTEHIKTWLGDKRADPVTSKALLLLLEEK